LELWTIIVAQKKDGIMHNDIRVSNQRLAEMEVDKCRLTTSCSKNIQLTAQEFITTTAAVTITTGFFFQMSSFERVHHPLQFSP
jgi:hypothetical protein